MAIPMRVHKRISANLSKYQKVLKKAKDHDIGESDTSIIITDILSDIFGFDKFSEITSEMPVRGTYCDLALKVKDKVRVIVECKAIGIELKDIHIRQAINYATNKGIDWAILTNGQKWQVFHITFTRPIAGDLIAEYDFLNLSSRNNSDVELLYMLTKEGLGGKVLNDYYDKQQAVNRYTVAAVIQTQGIKSAIRRELKRLQEGIRINTDDIDRILVSEVLKREVIEDEKAQQAKKKITQLANKKIKVTADK